MIENVDDLMARYPDNFMIDKDSYDDIYAEDYLDQYSDDTYGFDDNTDLYDPNMDVSIDETDRLIEDIESVQGNFEDALTKAQKYFRVPFENTSEIDLEKKSEMMSEMIAERDEIPIKLVEIEIDHNLVPNNTIT